MGAPTKKGERRHTGSPKRTDSLSKDQYLEKLYTDPGTAGSFSGPGKLKEIAHIDGRTDISSGDIDRFLQKQDTYTANRPARHKFKRSRVIAYGANDLVDIDLADVSKLAKFNKKIKYLLVSVDVLSRLAKVRGLRDKTAASVLGGLQSIFGTGSNVRMIRSDLGLEIKNSKVEAFFKKEGIRHYFATPPIKAGYAERFIQTLKQLIYRYLYHVNSFTYITVLDLLVQNYNSRPHRGLLGLAPRDVTSENTASLWNRMYVASPRGRRPKTSVTRRKNLAKKYRFDKGNLVRISFSKSPFQRAYKQRFTDEVFTVIDRYPQDGIPVYKLSDMKHRPIEGLFYGPELQAVSNTEIWKIERILRRKGKGKNRQVLVRWKGFGPEFDSWILHSSVQNTSENSSHGKQ